jgi:hypothetical protein
VRNPTEEAPLIRSGISVNVPSEKKCVRNMVVEGGEEMKRIILTLCVFIALLSVDNAAGFYRCVDRDGNTMLTDTPPPGAKCKEVGGSKESTPSKGQRIEAENQAIDKKDKQPTIKDSMLQQKATPTPSDNSLPK